MLKGSESVRESQAVIQDLMLLAKRYESEELVPQDYYEKAAPLICELTRAMAVSNEESSRRSSELERSTQEYNTIVESLMVDDTILRASYAFIKQSNYHDQFIDFFESSLVDVTADIRRSEFRLVEKTKSPS